MQNYFDLLLKKKQELDVLKQEKERIHFTLQLCNAKLFQIEEKIEFQKQEIQSKEEVIDRFLNIIPTFLKKERQQLLKFLLMALFLSIVGSIFVALLLQLTFLKSLMIFLGVNIIYLTNSIGNYFLEISSARRKLKSSNVFIENAETKIAQGKKCMDDLNKKKNLFLEKKNFLMEKIFLINQDIQDKQKEISILERKSKEIGRVQEEILGKRCDLLMNVSDEKVFLMKKVF